MLYGADPISSEAVQTHLEKILATDGFVRSERLSRFLRYVVERTLEGRLDELKEYIVGVEVYQKGPDFDPRMDTAVRVDARRLRAKLDEYYAGPGAGDAVRILLPKGGYMPVFSRGGSSGAEMVWRPLGGSVQGRLAVLIMFLAGTSLWGGHWSRRKPDSTKPASPASRDFVRTQAPGGERISSGGTGDDEWGAPGFSPAHSALAGSYFSLADLKPAGKAAFAPAPRRHRGRLAAAPAPADEQYELAQEESDGRLLSAKAPF